MPIISDFSSFQSSDDPLEVLVTLVLDRADSITCGWGDGTEKSSTVTGSGPVFFKTTHSYAGGGQYPISVTVSNDQGESTLHTVYLAGGNSFYFNPKNVKVSLNGIKSSESDGMLRLASTYTIRNAIGVFEPIIEWTYSFDGSERSSIVGVGGINGAQIDDDGSLTVPIASINALAGAGNEVSFYLKATFDIAGQEYVAETKYVYNDSSFFSQHGYLFIVFALITGFLCLLYFYYDAKSPYMMMCIIFMAILAILCFLYKDFNGIIDVIRSRK